MAHFTCNFISYSFRRAVTINVIIPSITSTDAEKSNASHKVSGKFPVLYLLHGYCNDYSTWERYTSIERYAEERMIAVVTFSGENNYYCDTSKFTTIDGPNRLFSPNYMNFIRKELPDFVTSMFPISNRTEEKYIAGLSMGGYGALINGFTKPYLYREVGSFSPLTTLCSEGSYGDFKSLLKEEKNIEPYLLIKKAMECKTTIPQLYYSFGNKDFLLDKLQWFKKALDDLQFPYRFNNVENFGHEWAFWDSEVKNFLDTISRDDYYSKNVTRKRNI